MENITIQITKLWATSLLQRIGYIKRKGSNAGKVLQPHLYELQVHGLPCWYSSRSSDEWHAPWSLSVKRFLLVSTSKSHVAHIKSYSRFSNCLLRTNVLLLTFALQWLSNLLVPYTLVDMDATDTALCLKQFHTVSALWVRITAPWMQSCPTHALGVSAFCQIKFANLKII